MQVSCPHIRVFSLGRIPEAPAYAPTSINLTVLGWPLRWASVSSDAPGDRLRGTVEQVTRRTGRNWIRPISYVPGSGMAPFVLRFGVLSLLGRLGPACICQNERRRQPTHMAAPGRQHWPSSRSHCLCGAQCRPFWSDGALAWVVNRPAWAPGMADMHWPPFASVFGRGWRRTPFSRQLAQPKARAHFE